MSGHSHWRTIKRTKETEDKKRSKIFSKLSKIISIASKEGGGDSLSSPKLRMAIDEAKKWNMPKNSIDKAIQKGLGGLPGEKLEEFLFEAYGPKGIAVIIEGITDNRNRSLCEIKKILNDNNGKLAEEGSVRWMFERKGCILINFKSQAPSSKNKETLELLVIEAGAEDIYWYQIIENESQPQNILEIYTKLEDIEKIKKNLEIKNIKIETTSLAWITKKGIEIQKEDEKIFQKLFEALDENDSVQKIYFNIKIKS